MSEGASVGSVGSYDLISVGRVVPSVVEYARWARQQRGAGQ